MGTLQAVFEVPKFIEVGLSTGQYQRVGGVIVEAGSKQVVTWLRDSNNIGNVVNSIVGNMNPLKLVFQAAETAVKLYDGHLTREAVEVLGQQVQMNHLEVLNALSATQQSIQSLIGMTLLTSTGHIVNLAVSGATFAIIIKRLDKLSDEIEELKKIIIAEFQRNRDIEFKKALQAARDALEGQGTLRDSAARSAIDGLFEAREHFFQDFDKSITDTTAKQENLLVANQYLIRAIYAEISRIRCYLVGNDRELALSRIAEDLPLLRERANKLIHLWLGENPAVFFHKDVSAKNLDRFLRIQQWLRGVEVHDVHTIFDILEEMRGEFWNQKVLSSGSLLTDLRSNLPLSRNKDTRDMTLSKNLSQIEILIENMDRLYGFEMEMRTMRLSFDEWNNVVSQEKLDHHGAALVFDSDVAQEHYEAMRQRLSEN